MLLDAYEDLNKGLVGGESRPSEPAPSVSFLLQESFWIIHRLQKLASFWKVLGCSTVSIFCEHHSGTGAGRSPYLGSQIGDLLFMALEEKILVIGVALVPLGLSGVV